MKDDIMFKEYMAALSELYDRPLSKLLTDLYWKILEPYTDEQCAVAFKEVILSSRFFPKPVDLVDAITGGKKSQAALAWIEVHKAIGRVGNYSSVQFADPIIHSAIVAMGGWPQICNRPDEPKWVQREFEKLYEVISAAHSDTHPSYLPGEHEIKNAAAGQDRTPEIIFIGPPQSRQIRLVSR